MKIKDIVTLAISTKVPILLWGAPGTGKTAAITHTAKTAGYHLEVITPAVREPADIVGYQIPNLTDSTLRIAPPDWAVRLSEHPKSILFLDEISCAPPSLQAACLRVVQERRVGNLSIDHVAIIAAANPTDTAANGFELSAPFANRFLHIYISEDSNEFCTNFPKYWGDPPILDGLPEKIWQTARKIVAEFIRHRPTALLAVPTDTAEQGRPWPSRRTWDAVSRIVGLAMMTKSPINPDLISGCVGEGFAGEFLAWYNETSLMDLDQLLKDPTTYEHPDRIDVVSATLSGLVKKITLGSDCTYQRWSAMWNIFDQAFDKGAQDIVLSSVKTLSQNPNGKKLIAKHGIPRPVLAKIGNAIERLGL